MGTNSHRKTLNPAESLTRLEALIVAKEGTVFVLCYMYLNSVITYPVVVKLSTYDQLIWAPCFDGFPNLPV